MIDRIYDVKFISKPAIISLSCIWQPAIGERLSVLGLCCLSVHSGVLPFPFSFSYCKKESGHLHKYTVIGACSFWERFKNRNYANDIYPCIRNG